MRGGRRPGLAQPPAGARPASGARRRCARCGAALALLAAQALIGAAAAAPYEPASDDAVLERLPAGWRSLTMREARRLHARLAAEPRDLALATRLAWQYVAAARAEADPRYLGDAQAALAPWWHEPAAPAEVLILRATIRQSDHAFGPALEDLARALDRVPDHVQARLTQATILRVTGDPRAARTSCLALPASAPRLLRATCLADADSLLGRAAAAYEALARAIEDSAAPRTISAWSVTVLAEIAERLGRDRAAEDHYRLALALNPADAYLAGAWADFLLDRARTHEVLRLIPDDTPSDALLLRRALAARAADAASARALAMRLDARLQAIRARGDASHLREEGRLALDLKRDPARALRLARANWAAQKEPADARLLLEAALAAGAPGAARPVLRWLEDTGLESVPLARLAARLEPAP